MADRRTRLIHEIRAVVRGAQEVERLGQNLEGVEGRARRGFGDPTRRLRRGLNDSVRSAANLRNVIVGLGVVLAGREIVQAGLAFERIERRIRAVTGSTAEATAELQFVRDVSDRLGLSLRETAEGYGSLLAATRGTALEGAQTREVFLAVSEASTAMGLTAEQTTGTFTALEQIVSKGRVSAEELRQQLGERLPGAFRIAARAIGVSTAELDKMLQLGELTAEDLLPQLARELRETFGEAAVRGANSAQAAFNRFQTSLFNLEAELAEGLLPAMQDTTDVITGALQDIRDNADALNESGGIDRFGDAVASTLAFLADAAVGAGTVIKNAFEIIGESLGSVAAQIMAVLQGDFQRALQIHEDTAERIAKNWDEILNAPLTAFRDQLAQTREESRRTQEAIERLDLSLGFPDVPAPGGGGGDAGSGERPTFAVTRRVSSGPRPGELSDETLDLIRRGRAVFEDTRTAAERYEAEIRDLEALHEAGAIGVETFNRAVEQAKQRLEDAGEQAGDTGEELSEFAIQAARSMQTAFANFLFDPFEDGLEGMADQFVVALRRMAAEAAAAEILQSIFSSGGSGGGGGGANAGFAAFLSSLFSFGTAHAGGIVGGPGMGQRTAHPAVFAGAQHFANGGLPGLGPNEVPIIAHRGEEVLTASDPRHRDNAGGGGTTVIQNITTPDAESFRRSRAAIRRDAQLGLNRR